MKRVPVHAVAVILSAMAAGPALSECSESVVDIRWPDGKARFAVEIADDAAERAEGLMFREALPSSAGMLFIYPEPEPVAFWMKNTLLPLDMLFIDATGTIRKVHANAVPGDLTPIPGEGPTRMVLEIRGGLAAAIGIAPGAELRHPALDQGLAAWPCNAP